MRYRVIPLKAWPVVGIGKMPLLVPVWGSPGWTWPSCRKSMFHVKADAGSGAPWPSTASPANAITSPARNRIPPTGAVMVGVGGVPTVIATGDDNVVLVPSETDSRAE